MHILLIHQAFASLDEAGGTRHHELARYLVDQGNQVTVYHQSGQLSQREVPAEDALDRKRGRSGRDYYPPDLYIPGFSSQFFS